VEHSARAVAAVTDVATTGFATMNGGTSGGKGGKTVTVSSLSQLADAAKGSDPKKSWSLARSAGPKLSRLAFNKSIGKKGASMDVPYQLHIMERF